MMATYLFVGSERTVFPGLAHPDGTTVVLSPGETVELDAVVDSELLKPAVASPEPAPAPAVESTPEPAPAPAAA